jgi:hypothetical protein
VKLPLALPDAVPQGEALAQSVAETLRLLQGDAVREPLGEPDSDGEPLALPEGVPVTHAVAHSLYVGDTVLQEEDEKDPVLEALIV